MSNTKQTATDRTPEQVLAELEENRRELDACDKVALHARQKALWAEGRALGLDSGTLAEKSGVESVTVRLYWNPEKAAERAEERRGKPRKRATKKG